MKKMGIAVIAGMFVLVSAGVGQAGPNVGGKNFNIQARHVSRVVAGARAAKYARTGTPVTVTDWHWVSTARPGSVRPGLQRAQAMHRVPARR